MYVTLSLQDLVSTLLRMPSPSTDIRYFPIPSVPAAAQIARFPSATTASQSQILLDTILVVADLFGRSPEHRSNDCPEPVTQATKTCYKCVAFNYRHGGICLTLYSFSQLRSDWTHRWRLPERESCKVLQLQGRGELQQGQDGGMHRLIMGHEQGHIAKECPSEPAANTAQCYK